MMTGRTRLKQWRGWVLGAATGLMLLPAPAQALMELSGSYGYSKQVYGDLRQNSIVGKSWSGALAIYLFAYTGIEVNYARSQDVTTELGEIYLSQATIIRSVRTTVFNESRGLGLRQAFAPRHFFVVPTLSLGYAKMVKEGQTDYDYDLNGATVHLESLSPKTQSDAMFGTFALKFNLSVRMTLDASVRTYFESEQYNRAKDNLRYEVGLSIII